MDCGVCCRKLRAGVKVKGRGIAPHDQAQKQKRLCQRDGNPFNASWDLARGADFAYTGFRFGWPVWKRC